VIIPPGPLKVLVATKPVDFRKGIDGLAALVREELRLNPGRNRVRVPLEAHG
jgi:transposase